MEQKPKVDLNAIIAKANKKTSQVKKSTEKVESKKDTYRILPGFKKYEYNGLVLRNATTKRIMSLKKANKKYQLINDSGKNIDLSTEQVKELVGPIKVVKPKIVKEKAGEKKKSKKDLVIELHTQGLTVKQIMEHTKFNYTTVFGAVNDYQIKSLFEAGKGAEEIATILDKNPKFVLSWLERYKFIKKA